jgi:O-antigen ligase
MPPVLALFLTLGFIGFLFRRDFRQRPNVTGAIWLPIVWFFIIASRPVSSWLNTLGFHVQGAVTLEEGSTVDSIVYFGLIVGGLCVLAKRQVSLAQVLRDNPWLALFVAYCFVAVVWSDFPIVALKRWVKILGHPIMVLVLLTEREPREAFITLMKRCGYLLFPVSVLWIKYYPAIGRKAGDWGGMSNVGVAGGKNELGAICLIWGLFFFWYVLTFLRGERTAAKRNERRLTFGLLLLTGYCLWKAHSSTSDISILLGAATILLLGFWFVNINRIGMYALAAVILFLVAQFFFDIYGAVVDTTGHNATIEGRAQLWSTLLHTDPNPIFGAGFESFWLGGRLEGIWEEYWWRPTQAHNGYLELYLNLGLVGLLLFIVVILATFRNCKTTLLEDFEWGRLTMGYLVAILAHNWTEAGFKGLSIMFLFLFLIAIKHRQAFNSSSSVRWDEAEAGWDLSTTGTTSDPSLADLRGTHGGKNDLWGARI